MTERIDHAQSARSLLDFIGSRQMRSDEATVSTTAAQVHATLALVEQQRLANLITLASMQGELTDEQRELATESALALVEYIRSAGTAISDPDDNPAIRPEIRVALGL